MHDVHDHPPRVTLIPDKFRRVVRRSEHFTHVTPQVTLVLTSGDNVQLSPRANSAQLLECTQSTANVDAAGTSRCAPDRCVNDNFFGGVPFDEPASKGVMSRSGFQTKQGNSATMT